MKKKTHILILLAVILAAAIIWGILLYASYDFVNHADRLSSTKVAEINTLTTFKAQTNSAISTQDVLLLHTLHKDRQEDSEAVFHIYRLPEGANFADYIDLRAEDLDKTAGLEYMGTLTCRLQGEDASTVYNLTVAYIK